MKRRDPNTFEDAVTRIAGELTWEGAGAVISVTGSRIRAASDPDRDPRAPLNMEQALALDVKYNNETGEGYPQLEVYMARVQALSPHRAMDPGLRMARAAKEYGEAIAAYHDGTRPDHEVERELREVITEIEGMIRDRKAGLRVVQGVAE